MDLASVLDVLGKEVGKGGGGRPQEPTVCFALLPLGIWLLCVGLRHLRAGILRNAWRQDGRSDRNGSERKVQTAESVVPGASRGRSHPRPYGQGHSDESALVRARGETR